MDEFRKRTFIILMSPTQRLTNYNNKILFIIWVLCWITYPIYLLNWKYPYNAFTNWYVGIFLKIRKNDPYYNNFTLPHEQNVSDDW